MGFSRQESWSGLLYLPPGDLPGPGIKLLSPLSLALQADWNGIPHTQTGDLEEGLLRPSPIKEPCFPKTVQREMEPEPAGERTKVRAHIWVAIPRARLECWEQEISGSRQLRRTRVDTAIVLELSYYVVPDAQRGGPLRAWCRVAFKPSPILSWKPLSSLPTPGQTLWNHWCSAVFVLQDFMWFGQIDQELLTAEPSVIFMFLCKSQPVHPKGHQSWILIGKDPDDGKDWEQEEKGATEDEMVGWHHRLNGYEFEQTQGDSKGQGSLVCCSSWVTKRQTWLCNSRVLLNGEKSKVFPLKSGTRKECPFLPLLFNTVLEVLATAEKKKK